MIWWIIAIWLAFDVGFLLGAAWCGMCKANKRLDGKCVHVPPPIFDPPKPPKKTKEDKQ